MKRLLRRFCREWLSVALLLFSFLFCGYLSLSATAAADILTVTTAGTGSGTVNSTPAGIACASGSSTNCSASFTNMSGITLTATPDWKSLPGVFSVGCSGTGSCFFNINGATGVTAIFNPNFQAAVIGMFTVPYASLSDAYANAKDQNNVPAHVHTFTENLILGRSIFIRLQGGREGIEYLSHPDSSFTTLHGYLDVQLGSVEIDSLIIE